MLINPLSRPLDLVGDKDLNYIQDETHHFVETADRIFVPVHGPFYYESLEIIDGVTGLKLREGEDYKCLHLLEEVSKLSTKEVYAAIYVTKKEISSANLCYSVPGGKYTDLSELYRELIKTYGNYRKPVYWSEILGLPDVYPVVPHMHSLMDLTEVGDLVTALDLVINAIFSKDFENWVAIYTYLDGKLRDLHNYKTTMFNDLEAKANALLIAASPFPKEFFFFNNTEDPNQYYPIGTWERRGDYLLYGQMHNEPNKLSTFDAPRGVGLIGMKLALWQYMANNSLFTMRVTVNRTVVDEGGTATFTISATGANGNEVIPYKLTGVVNATGQVTLNASGNATVTVSVPTNPLTTGTRQLRLTLTDRPHVYKEIDISDRVRGEFYQIGFYRDQYGLQRNDTMDEGGTGYIVIETENVPNGTVVTMIYDGTLLSSDLTNPLPSTVRIVDNIAAIEVKPRLDRITDGEKYLRVGISVDNYILPSVATVFYVRDTSKTGSAELYWTNTNNSNVPVLTTSEGSTAYLVIQTTNIDSSIAAQITWSGTITREDLNANLPTTAIINASGRTVIPITFRNDNLTEGDEVITANVRIGADIDMVASIYVEDTSRNDNIDVRFSTNSIGTNNVTTINEGSSIYLVVKTEDIPGEGSLKLEWSGTTNADDFLTELPNTIAVKNNYGYLNILIKADNLTEGNESLGLRVYDNNDVLLVTRSLVIVDSSTAPTYAVSFSSTSGVVTPITQANEGQTVYGVIQTTQVPDGTVMYVETLVGTGLATTVNGDVTEDVATTVIIDDGVAYLPISLRMDERRDGDKPLTIRLRKDNPTTSVLTTASITVNDTSVVPTYQLKWSSSYSNDNVITSAQAGQTIYARIKTTSIAPGTPLYIEYGGAGLGTTNNANDFLQAHSSEILPRIVRIDGEGMAIIPITISKTLLGNVALVLRLTLSRDATGAVRVLTSNLNISKPTYALTFASNAAGTTTITSAREGNTIYAVLRTTNVPNGTVFNTHFRIGDEAATIANGDVTNVIPDTITVTNNLGVVPIVLARDGIAEGIEQIDFNLLYDHMSKDEEMIYFATQTINLSDS